MLQELFVIGFRFAEGINPCRAFREGKVVPRCHNEIIALYKATRRSRSALVMTETDERLIAAAAIMGESRRPVTG